LLFFLALSCANHDEGPRSMLTADQAAQMRASCAFGAGTTAGLSLAKDAPLGDEIPIDTVVVLMMENRSFDHIFGELSKSGQPDAEGPPEGVTNPDSNGNPIARFHQTDYCFRDTNHEWDGSHVEFDDGKNDGFVVANEDGAGDGTRAMGYYDATDLPWLYAAANAYAISDRHFASVMGPTFPNREYLYAATSYGRTVNSVFTEGENANFMSLLEDYNAAHEKSPVTWHIYYEGVPGPAIFLDTATKYLDNITRFQSFLDDTAAGMLSNVNILDANIRDEWGGGDDFHPPGDPQVGEAFLAQIVDALTHSPQWPHMALFITFDEHGGLYDHVPPPKACAPDSLAPTGNNGVPAPYDFAQLGFRVPLIVVSPYARPHFVSHVVSDHTSILRFIEARFRLPALTARDANADPLYDLFDFKKAALKTPPPLPTPTPDAQKLADCEAKYPLKSIDFLGDMATPPDMGM
jgi:phospholipase C